ncbi:hypothetical protein [Streptomyces sp. NRRL F-5123]|uniref:hypothetical protein n=1 Tax=Streptomyces sp. NRRL F-5123 TaxID=1463856 RepID=UPI0004E1E6D4|nr:hypothetical protein [Streptomyces sp. NRRL F-5123]
MSGDQLTQEETAPEDSLGDERRIVRLDEEGPLKTWSRCAPIRLAGYEDDPSETHILRSID